jgi:hypothetical protein
MPPTPIHAVDGIVASKQALGSGKPVNAKARLSLNIKVIVIAGINVKREFIAWTEDGEWNV